MKTIFKSVICILSAFLLQACNDFPVDSSDLLITDSEECYISSLILRGPDNRDVLQSFEINEEEGTITGVAKFGTNIQYVKPQCNLAKDCIITPSMGVWTDFSEPRQYTVISGNRVVKKTYTITINVQGE